MSLQASYFHHLAAIGFSVHNQVEFERLLKLALERGKVVPTLTGKYVAWQPGEGVELWVKVQARSVLACTPHFSGEGALTIEVTSLHARSETVADGALRGTALPRDTASGAYPVVMDLPGFEAVAAHLVPPQTVSVQPAVFAHTMRCFVSDASFAAWRRKQPPGAPSGEEALRFPDFTRNEPLPDGVPSATVLLTARVLKADMRTNPVTNQSFIALVAQMPGGGTADVVADPQTASGELAVGGLIEGTFWLSGRLLESAPEAPDAPQRSGNAPVLSRLTHWVRGGS